VTTLTRNSTGLLLREDFSAANGWTAGTGWSRVSAPCMVTFGAAPQVLLAPRAAGQPDYDGVREGQLYVESGTWYLLYDAGDNTTGWLQYLATSSDRGLTWSRAVQSIQYDTGASGSYAAVATGWLEKRSSTYYLHRVTAATTFASPNVGLPNDPYGWDIWHASSLGGTWTFDRSVPGAGGYATSIIPGSTVLDSGTYYHFIEGYTSPPYTIGYATAAAPGGPWTVGSALLTITDFFSVFTPENAKTFYHPTLLMWVMLVNLIDPAGTHTSRNAVALSSTLTNWAGANILHTQWNAAICDTSGGAVGVQTHVTGPDGALVHEDGLVPFVYDADPRASSPGWHRGRSIRSAVYEPAAYKLHYTDATTTPHRYNKTFSHTDFVAEFEVDTAGLVAGSYIAFEVRTNGTTGYRLIVANDGATALRLETMAGSTVQNGSGVAGTSGISQRIKISCVGTTLKAWFNGELQVNVTDSTYASGTEVAFVGKNCTADVRLFHMRSSDVLTIHGLGAGEQIWLRTHGELPWDTVTANGSGVATYTGTHYPLSRVQGSGGDAQTSDRLLWGGDDLTYSATSIARGATSASGIPVFGA
jgi:hypothetical protein